MPACVTSSRPVPLTFPCATLQAAAQGLFTEQVQLFFGRVLLTWLWHLVSLQLPDLQEAAKAGEHSRRSTHDRQCLQSTLTTLAGCLLSCTGKASYRPLSAL